MINYKIPNVVIVLGGGLGKDHKPALYTKERLSYLIKNKKRFKNIPIIVSGKHSQWLKEVPKHTEAGVMERYLVEKGFDPSLVILEDKSKDTIGNIYFSKQIIKKHREWKNVLILTTDAHIPRSKWLFNKFFGPNYKVIFQGVPSKYAQINTPGRKKYEQFSINLNRKRLGKFKDGDDKAIMKALRKFHPAYSKSKEATQLRQELSEMKKKLLGFATPIPG